MKSMNLATLGIAVFFSAVFVEPGAAESPAARTVAIGLADNTTSATYLAGQIRSQLSGQGARVSGGDARNAAAAALNELKARNRDPQKGIILIHFKKLKATVCISWGEHKDYCNKKRAVGFAGIKALSL